MEKMVRWLLYGVLGETASTSAAVPGVTKVNK